MARHFQLSDGLEVSVHSAHTASMCDTPFDLADSCDHARRRSAVAHSEQAFKDLLDSYRPRPKPHSCEQQAVVVTREVLCVELD